MWCTFCHKTFSWKTNKLICPSVIHNPHYIEFNNLSGSLEWHDFVRLCKDKQVVIPSTLEYYFMMSKTLQQIYLTKIEQIRHGLEDIGVKYILNEMKYTTWKHRMYSYKIREQNIEFVIKHANQLISCIHKFINDPSIQLDELEDARIYFNKKMKELSSVSKYKPHVLYIDSTINLTNDC